jgi:hypothetical protein
MASTTDSKLPLILGALFALLLGSRAWAVGQEYPRSFFSSAAYLDYVKSERGLWRRYFLYYNPTLDSGDPAQYVPLTIEQKVAEQAGEKYAGILRDQFDLKRGNRNTPNESLTILQTLVRTRRSSWPWLLEADAIRNRALQVEQRFRESGDTDSDNEVDAIRHFFGACRLTQVTGVRVATDILASHEVSDISMSSLMDRFNNHVAVDGCQTGGPWHDLNEDQKLDQAVALLRENRLVHLVSSWKKDFTFRPDDFQGFRAWAEAELQFELR